MNAWNKEPGIIISEIKMIHASNHCYFWLVEGPSDSKFFSLRKYDNVELIISGGKRNIVKAMEKLKEDPLYGKTIGIVDHDIDWLLNIKHDENIVTTDPRDIEGILLRSNALDKLLVEYGDIEKVKTFEENKGITIRQFVHDVSTFFGKIRAVNDLNDNVCLKKLKPQIFIDESNWSYNYKKIITYCVDNLHVCSSEIDLIQKINTLPNAAPWHYVRGHDALNILTGGFVKVFGVSKVDENKIQTALRMGLERDEYEKTSLFKNLSSWRLKNMNCDVIEDAHGNGETNKRELSRKVLNTLKRLRFIFNRN